MSSKPEAGDNGIIMGVQPGQTVEQVLAFDIPRIWASGVQVTPTADGTFIVFREQIGTIFAAEGEEDKERVMVRNVASVVIPTSVAKQLAQILDSQITAMEAKSAAEDGAGDD